MKDHNEIKLESLDDVTRFDILGEVTAATESFLDEAYRDANKLGASKIILKFYENTYINSGGIAVLIQFLSEAKENNQQVRIIGLSDHFHKIFHMVGISKIATICSSETEAMKSFAGP